LLGPSTLLPESAAMRCPQPITLPSSSSVAATREVRIPASSITLVGDLALPPDCCGVVVFAHGTGSSRHSPRDRAVAAMLRSVGFATLLFDLRTPEEESLDRLIAWMRADPMVPAQRLAHVVEWLHQQRALRDQRIGFFGSGTGAAGALLAAAALPEEIGAVVCRGGRPDLVEHCLAEVQAPTLLLAGERDPPVLERNREALTQFVCDHRLEVIEGASHLFREPGVLDQVSGHAAAWFRSFLTASAGLH
jgi:putative phosphoribosyl transferase